MSDGSIIEIDYTIRSDNWNSIRDWEFQHDIPVLESEYITVIPSELGFKPHFWGSQKIEQLISQKWDDDNYLNKIISQYRTSHVPAFPNEPYILNKKDYLSRVEFELTYVESAQGKKNFSFTWSELNKQLLEDENFGKQLFNNTYLLEAANDINALYTEPIQKINAAYDFIHRRMKWNGEYGIYPSIDIQKAFDLRTGNIADINLLLVKLLRTLEVKCAPVLVSTVRHGQILPTYPSLSKLNYVLVVIPQEDKRILLDAADPFASFDLVPPKCFNGPGFMLNDGGGTWIDIKLTRPGQVQADYKLKLNDEFIWEGTYRSGISSTQLIKFGINSKTQRNYQHILNSCMVSIATSALLKQRY
jgi:hypothetical protein